MLHYYLQVIAFQFLFLIVYDVCLRNETFFNLNRLYLLGTTVLSLSIPFIKIDQIRALIDKDLVISLPEVFIGNATTSIYSVNPEALTQAGGDFSSHSVSIWMIILISGMAIATCVLLLKILKFVSLLSKHSKQSKGKLVIVNLTNSTKAFSFFNYIFLGEKLNAQEKSSVLQHELVHVNQRHTLDLLFFEILRIAFWFNPFVYIYQNRMATLHEYIADSQAVEHHNKADYYNSLLAQVFETQQFSFVNPFFKHSLIKKRILMLGKSKSKQINLSKYLLIVPILTGMLVYSSCSIFQKKTNQTVVKTETKVIDSAEIPFAVVDEVPIYQSCEDLKTNDERKKCMSQNIARHVNLNFNTSIGDSLGLVGRQRINVMFKINKEGFVTDVKARAPHPQLEEEAKRVVQTLPQLIPGKHKGKTVIVPYSLPILFQIEGKSNKKTVAAPIDEARVKTLKEKFKDADEVPFVALDKAPVSEGCKDFISEKESKSCFSGFISGFVNENFNVKLASKIGLVGKQRINVLFKVDKNGSVQGARARAAHPDLEAEAIRVINSLPQFAPGELNGKVVTVNYSLPIIFEVHNQKN
ncbi:energy transducer TonB [Psychroserpens algicola]|uniref:Energy transducer TonB n=1 Tax=Psychroserpens algicola TaxID=1719034 RepID=A0ABT0H4K5_9FLAO|nr:energy transducer TonB [Psychroserpens algicola]MCK8479313.1 energy transducer TonB [Psychroserpens algicola]